MKTYLVDLLTLGKADLLYYYTCVDFIFIMYRPKSFTKFISIEGTVPFESLHRVSPWMVWGQLMYGPKYLFLYNSQLLWYPKSLL